MSILLDEFSWNRKTILLLLSCVQKRKNILKDPKIKKKSMWNEIKKEYANNGYTKINEHQIERKFRNMKHTHKTIKDNKDKKKTGRGQVTWEYFEVMDNIFEQDRTVNIGHTISSMVDLSASSTSDIIRSPSPANSVQSKMMSLLPTLTPERPALAPEHPILTPAPPALAPEPPFAPLPPKRKENAQKSRQLYSLRKQQLEIEKERIEEIRKLRETIERNNEIQLERNSLLREICKK